ncbi:MAG: hypothetical protein R2819_04830 [Allomuricauda sp.]
MGLLLCGIGAGILLFVVLLWLHSILFKLFEINPLLDLGGTYIVYHVFADKLSQWSPTSWQVKQFENLLLTKGSLGFVLHLDKPEMSAYDMATATFGICLIGYFIYAFTLKPYLAKKKMDQEMDT